MIAIGELEIRLSHPVDLDGSKFEVRLRFQAAGSAAWLESEPALVSLVLTEFDEPVLQGDPDEYGRKLTGCLFGDDGVRTFFEKASAAAQLVEGSALRVRLAIASDSAGLHGLRWELLHDPWSKRPMVLGERVWFSRHLNSHNWTAVVLRPKERLKALIAVANPVVEAKHHPVLAAIDGAAEIARALEHLNRGGIEADVVQGPETIDQLRARLHDEYDVLYLVCHGQLAPGAGARESVLWLEGAEKAGTGRGEAKRVQGDDLVNLLESLTRRPRLVVLASCQSANDEKAALADGAPLAALGPRLAEIGVPAVLAMQGKVPMSTVAKFMPAFFRELARDGRIDRAVGAARWAATQAKCHETWMPALFSRLESNALWNTGFATEEDTDGFRAWTMLLDAIQGGYFTPVLGPGLLKEVFGTARQIARTWSCLDESNAFPLAPHGRDELTQVNQYFSRQSGQRLPYDMLRKHQFDRIRSRFRHQLPAGFDDADLNQLDGVLSALGRCRREADAMEPHRILAGLPLPLFLTANPDDLLSDALAEAGKAPRQGLCPWTSRIRTPPDLASFIPKTESPLVYHLLGRMSDHRTMVLTEDDYLQYLIELSARRELVPGVVRTALSETVLVFLGFQVEHWTFRALLRGLLALTDQEPAYAPIAVQVDPDENDFVDIERARRYLSRALPVGGNQSVQVYWGTAGDFLEQLADQRRRRNLAGAAK